MSAGTGSSPAHRHLVPLRSLPRLPGRPARRKTSRRNAQRSQSLDPSSAPRTPQRRSYRGTPGADPPPPPSCWAGARTAPPRPGCRASPVFSRPPKTTSGEFRRRRRVSSRSPSPPRPGRSTRAEILTFPGQLIPRAAPGRFRRRRPPPPSSPRAEAAAAGVAAGGRGGGVRESGQRSRS